MVLLDGASMSRVFSCIIVVLSVLNCSFATASFELTRAKSDSFKNPTVKICDWEEKSAQFCKDKNARCSPKGCCSCLCDYARSTFDRSTLACKRNDDFRIGCSLMFVNVYPGNPIKILDLSNDGASAVAWKVNRGIQLKSCRITSIVLFHNGVDVGKEFLEVDKEEKKGHYFAIKIKWDDDDTSSKYYGRIFKVNVLCKVKSKQEKSFREKTDCFVFKSSGKLTISPRPSPSTSTLMSTTTSLKPEASLLPTTALMKTIPVLTTSVLPLEPHLVRSSSTMLSLPKTPLQPEPPLLLTQTTTSSVFYPSRAVPVEKHTKSSEGNGNTPVPSKKQPEVVPRMSRIRGTFNPNVDPNAAEQSDGSGSNVAVVSSVVVVVVLVLVGVLLLVLWTRRKSGMKRQQSQTAILSHGGANMTTHNEMSMNNLPENIYAEADSVVSPRSVRVDNCVYEYADNNHYTDLNKKIPEKEHDYQALVTGNLYEHIPSSSLKPAINEQPAISEPFYHVVDGQTVDNEAVDSQAISEAVYNVLDDPTQPGNYEAPDKAIPPGPGIDQSERVYSILEDDENDASLPTPESNYLAVLPPEQLHYEQPVDMPISRT